MLDFFGSPGEDSKCQDKKIVRPLPPDFDFVGRSLHTSEEACKNRDIDDGKTIGLSKIS